VLDDGGCRPVAARALACLVAASVEQAIFVINASKHQLLDYFGDGRRFGCRLSYVVQDRDEAGSTQDLAHALDAAYHLVRERTVVFAMADTVIEPPDAFRTAVDRLQDGDAAALLMFPTDRPRQFGMVEHDEQLAVRIYEKSDCPPPHLTHMWGGMAWRPAFTEFLHERVASGGSDFAQILNEAIDAGLPLRIAPVAAGQYHDLGTVEGLAAFGSRRI